MSDALIYALLDPRTLDVRYIGKSEMGLRRPNRHSYPSILAKDRTYKGNWIRELKALNLEYRVEVLEETSKEKLSSAEVFWIAEGRRRGWPLTNLTDGGEGGGHCQETREKLSRLHLGRKVSAEGRARISAARRKYPAPSEEVRRQRVQHFKKPVEELTTGRKFDSVKEAADALGLWPEDISCALHGRKTHVRGFRFSFLPTASVLTS